MWTAVLGDSLLVLHSILVARLDPGPYPCIMTMFIQANYIKVSVENQKLLRGMPMLGDKLTVVALSNNWGNKPVLGAPLSPPSYWKTMGQPCGAVGRSPMKLPRAGQSTTKTCTRPILQLLQLAFYVNID